MIYYHLIMISSCHDIALKLNSCKIIITYALRYWPIKCYQYTTEDKPHSFILHDYTRVSYYSGLVLAYLTLILYYAIECWYIIKLNAKTKYWFTIPWIQKNNFGNLSTSQKMSNIVSQYYIRKSYYDNLLLYTNSTIWKYNGTVICYDMIL